ncbi:VOC family protein [Amycolatopsis silviterrae]|uniref:VOC family protein n=1 Tax=Amycolatopsis silviterrae TaxID=1656914 RepID=A0ABW5HL97_9PSEU
MALHRVSNLTLGVPDVGATAQFYDDFGLIRRPEPDPDGAIVFGTVDAGEQLRLVHSPFRRLMEAALAADTPEDCDRIASNLRQHGFDAAAVGEAFTRECIAVEPATALTVRVIVRPRLVQEPEPAPSYNGPGRFDRVNARADGVVRTDRVRPRRLGHFVVGTTDFETTKRFFVEGMGFKVSDIVKDRGVFLRCSTDHHNLLVQRAPVPFLHHTSWQVEDVDQVGRGAMDMLEGDPARHAWGLGRHYAGSNFFWYLKDPAGNFAEYHSDMDCIPEDALWTPEVLEGARGLFTWGPPPPPSLLEPEDLADLMISGHG